MTLIAFTSMEQNVWVDLLGCWSAPGTVRRLVQIPLLASTSSPYFVRPAMESILQIQQEISAPLPSEVKLVDEVHRYSAGKFWIPTNAEERN